MVRFEKLQILPLLLHICVFTFMFFYDESYTRENVRLACTDNSKVHGLKHLFFLKSVI